MSLTKLRFLVLNVKLQIKSSFSLLSTANGRNQRNSFFVAFSLSFPFREKVVAYNAHNIKIALLLFWHAVPHFALGEFHATSTRKMILSTKQLDSIEKKLSKRKCLRRLHEKGVAEQLKLWKKEFHSGLGLGKLS